MIELPIKERILIYLNDHQEMQSKDAITEDRWLLHDNLCSIYIW